jgi:hypothetical protein
VKRCPTCNKTFTEDHLSFCVEDGTPLVMANSVDDEATVVRSGSADSSTASSGSSAASGERAAYQPPGSYVPPGYSGERKRRNWPWLFGGLVALLVVAGIGIALALSARNIKRKYDEIQRRNTAPASTNERDANGNSNSNFNSSNQNENGNRNLSTEDSTPPPTDEVQVLSALTDLEHEWTVANINADKKKLDRILADDYVGIDEGRAEGKAEYLNTIKRNTSIQKWNFENLKVNLKSDRATLTGTIRLDVKNDQDEVRPVAFLFTDKFVWREGRWQATGSAVKPLEE